MQKTTKKVGVLVRKRERETETGPKRRVIKKGVLTHLPSVMDEREVGSNTPTSKVKPVRTYMSVICACMHAWDTELQTAVLWCQLEGGLNAANI